MSLASQLLSLSVTDLYQVFVSSANLLRNKGVLSYACDELYTRITASFLDDEFEDLYKLSESADTRGCLGTFVDSRDKAFRWRLHILLQYAWSAIKPNATFLDLGCGSGMIANPLLSRYAKRMREASITYVMIDSFTGSYVGDNSSTAAYSEGDGAYEMACSIASRYSDITLLERGYLPHKLFNMSAELLQLTSFISLDLNTAKPELITLEYLLPFLKSGCVIVLDDFGFPGSKEQNASHIFFSKKHNIPLIHLPTGQGILLIP